MLYFMVMDIPLKKIGRYEILYQINSGGMGTVFRGRDEDLDRAVAIKMLSPELFANLDEQLRFIQEAKIVAKLDHPNITKIYAIEYEEANAYLIMEYVEGQSLEDLLEKNKQLSIPDAINIIEQLAGALFHAHSKGIVHLDVKPSNILISDKGTVKLTDFGISFDKSSDFNLPSSFEYKMGTPKYMSPEQFESEKVDKRSDIYSLGVLAFEMLTGFPPFEAANREQYHEIHNKKPIPDLEKGCPNCPPQLKKFIYKCLEKNRMYRLSSLENLCLSSEEKLSVKNLTKIRFSWKWGGPLLLSILFLANGFYLYRKFKFKSSRPSTVPAIEKKQILETPLDIHSDKNIPQAKLLPVKNESPPPNLEIPLNAYSILTTEKYEEIIKNFSFPELLQNLSQKNKRFEKRQEAIQKLLWISQNNLEELVPLLHANDLILVKNIAYILSIRNYKACIADFKKRIENETNEELLSELYRSLGYFQEKNVKIYLNIAFQKCSSLPLMIVILNTLYENGTPETIEKAKLMLQMVEDESTKAELYAFLASNQILDGLTYARSVIQNSSAKPEKKEIALRILFYSPDTAADLSLITENKRDMYKSIPLMETFLKASLLLKTNQLSGEDKYHHMETECKKNEAVIAWLVLHLITHEKATAKTYIEDLLTRYSLKEYRDFIRAYYLFHYP